MAQPSNQKPTILYIDGFNLYYGAVKGTPLRWLDPLALGQALFPSNDIVGVKFFTAAVESRPADLGKDTRQQVYWRALRTLPNTEIIEGHFKTREKFLKVVNPPPDYMKVYKTEEKGSDVNLASHLLMDGFTSKYEAAIVVSGDSDLVAPIRLARERLGKVIGVLNPQRVSGPGRQKPRRSAGLPQAASFYRSRITWNQLLRSQFPDTLTDKHGSFTKPTEWA